MERRWFLGGRTASLGGRTASLGGRTASLGGRALSGAARALAAATCALGLAGCSASRTPGDTPAQPATKPSAAAVAVTAPLPSAASDSAPAPATSEAASAAPDSPPAPAERFDPTLPSEVPVAGDLVAQVAHGAVGNRRAIVYLHGVCGNVHKFRDWTEAAVHYATVVAVLGDDKCKEPGRYKWGYGVERTDRRIVAALRAVSAVRGAPLDTEAVTVVGYSQGSARAEALVRAFPARYRRAVLVAGPKEHAPSSFREALGVAVVAGQKDLKDHLVESAEKALKAGVRARYFELPGAHHGDYGPEAVRVMGEILSWVYAEHG